VGGAAHPMLAAVGVLVVVFFLGLLGVLLPLPF